MTVCLVTGGAGFIGSRLVETLVGRNCTVRVLDNLSTGSLANLSSVQDQIDFYFGDLSDLELTRKVIQGVELVFYLAANLNWGQGEPDTLGPFPSRAINALHALIAAREAKVKRLVFASSCTVYGQTSPYVLKEDDEPHPVTPYAVSKLAGEQLCSGFTDMYGLETVRLRYFNVYGPGLPGSSPYAGSKILRILKAMLMGRNPVVSGDGRLPQDLIYVDDVVRATLLAAEAELPPGAVYNIGSGSAVTSLELIDTLNCILGSSMQPIHTSYTSDDLQLVADISRATKQLGFSPQVNPEQGLRTWIEGYSSWRTDLQALERKRRDFKSTPTR